MKLNDIITENYPFHNDTTEMPMYDNMMQNPEYFEKEKGLKSKLLKMSPQEYIDAVVKGRKSTEERVMRERDPDLIKKYAKKMKDGEKFPILTLDYSRGEKVSQEGLHRAAAAKINDIKLVPVLIVKSVDNINENVNEMISTMKKSGITDQKDQKNLVKILTVLQKTAIEGRKELVKVISNIVSQRGGFNESLLGLAILEIASPENTYDISKKYTQIQGTDSGAKLTTTKGAAAIKTAAQQIYDWAKNVKNLDAARFIIIWADFKKLLTQP